MLTILLDVCASHYSQDQHTLINLWGVGELIGVKGRGDEKPTERNPSDGRAPLVRYHDISFIISYAERETYPPRIKTFTLKVSTYKRDKRVRSTSDGIK